MIGHRNIITRQTILYLSNPFYISLDLYIHMDSLNIFLPKYIGLANTINIWTCMLMYLFKEDIQGKQIYF
jgi:hypothetical protein